MLSAITTVIAIIVFTIPLIITLYYSAADNSAARTPVTHSTFHFTMISDKSLTIVILSLSSVSSMLSLNKISITIK